MWNEWIYFNTALLFSTYVFQPGTLVNLIWRLSLRVCNSIIYAYQESTAKWSMSSCVPIKSESLLFSVIEGQRDNKYYLWYPEKIILVFLISPWALWPLLRFSHADMGVFECLQTRISQLFSYPNHKKWIKGTSKVKYWSEKICIHYWIKMQ